MGFADQGFRAETHADLGVWISAFLVVTQWLAITSALASARFRLTNLVIPVGSLDTPGTHRAGVRGIARE